MTSNSVTNGKGYTVQPKDYQIAPLEAKAITGYFKATRVAIGYDESTYTKGIADQLRDLLTKANVQVAAFQTQARHFAAAIRGTAPALASAEDGVQLMQMVDALYASAGAGREIAVGEQRERAG